MGHTSRAFDLDVSSNLSQAGEIESANRLRVCSVLLRDHFVYTSCLLRRALGDIVGIVDISDNWW
jgi:hypothetical protein